MKVYEAGDIGRSTATFTDPDTGQTVDPATVSFVYTVDGADTELTYTSATVPAPGVVARLSVGVFRAEVDLTGFGGKSIRRRWVSTGTGQTVSPVETWIVNE